MHCAVGRWPPAGRSQLHCLVPRLAVISQVLDFDHLDFDDLGCEVLDFRIRVTAALEQPTSATGPACFRIGVGASGLWLTAPCSRLRSARSGIATALFGREGVSGNGGLAMTL